MTVRRKFTALLALAALLLGAGCGGGDSLNTAIETDDSVYRQGKQLQRQGRNPEALVAFLKVIEKRGEQYSPESHLEAGLIYLKDIKNPVEATHHFNRYLNLLPKSKEVPYVRGLVETARREFGKSLPGRVLEDRSQLMNLRDQVETLQRDNEQLRAEIVALRGGTAAAPLLSMTRATADGAMARPVAPRTVADDSPIALAPPPSTPSSFSLRPTPNPATPPKPAARTHTVAAHETLYGISVKYARKVDDLFNANRDVMKAKEDLKPGMVLKIP